MLNLGFRVQGLGGGSYEEVLALLLRGIVAEPVARALKGVCIEAGRLRELLLSRIWTFGIRVVVGLEKVVK